MLRLSRERMWGLSVLLGCAVIFLIIAIEPKGGERIITTAIESDEATIRQIVQDQVSAWNRGDAAAYSRQFASDGTFTNIRGQFFTGHEAFLKQHEVIFQGIFKDSTVQQDIVSLKFIRADIAIVETLTSVSGVAQTSPGTARDSQGRLRTRLLQVIEKRGKEWKIVAYHNVDVKPGVPVPEPH